MALNIKITGRSDAVTSGMKKRAAEKVSKIMKFHDRITWVDVILDADKQRSKVEVSAGLSRGTTLIGKAESGDMYTAIDQSVEKITRQLRRHKEKLKDYRPRRSEPVAPESAENDEDVTE